MKLETLNDVEIFASGKWNGHSYTDDDLDEIVRAYDETREHLKPYLKIGHKPNDLLRNDGLPSAGWITSLRRVKDRLVATISNVPRKIAELIRRRAYGRVSSEIYIDPVIQDKKYRYALKAVALLGGETPAVGSLSDFIDLYGLDVETCMVGHGKEGNTTTVTIDFQRKEKQKMPEITIEQREYSQLQKKAVSADMLSTEVEGLKSRVQEFSQKSSALEKENAELKKYREETQAAEVKRFASEVEAFFDQAIKEEKITPAMKEKYLSEAKKSKESFEFVRGVIDDLPAHSQEYSHGGQSRDAGYEPESMNAKGDTDGADIDRKIRALQREYADRGETLNYEQAMLIAERKEG